VDGMFQKGWCSFGCLGVLIFFFNVYSLLIPYTCRCKTYSVFGSVCVTV
jgi:hypothetical protein